MAFSTFTVLCNHHLYVVPNLFQHPQRRPHTFSAVLPYALSPPSPPQPPACLLSVRTGLSWTSHSSGITQYVGFDSWLFPLGPVPVRGVHARVGVHGMKIPCWGWVIFHAMNLPHSADPFFHLQSSEPFPLSGSHE